MTLKTFSIIPTTSVLAWANELIRVTVSWPSQILYYSGFHSAKKSNCANGCYPAWNMFESYEIIIHRAEQITGSTYENILKKYK